MTIAPALAGIFRRDRRGNRAGPPFCAALRHRRRGVGRGWRPELFNWALLNIGLMRTGVFEPSKAALA